MLMTALAAGRWISLVTSAAGAAYAARTTGALCANSRVVWRASRRSKATEEPLACIVGTAYLLDAARRLTAPRFNQGHHPAVISGIMKLHATERMRSSVNDAMDIHGGKAIIDGPHNYLGNLYRSVPIGITVEGANILTRNLIVFGQGAIRSHPYLLKEMNALGDRDHAKISDAFSTGRSEAHRSQPDHAVPGLGPQLEWWNVRTSARCRRGHWILSPALALLVGVCPVRRYGAAHAWRRAGNARK